MKPKGVCVCVCPSSAVWSAAQLFCCPPCCPASTRHSSPSTPWTRSERTTSTGSASSASTSSPTWRCSPSWASSSTSHPAEHKAAGGGQRFTDSLPVCCFLLLQKVLACLRVHGSAGGEAEGIDDLLIRYLSVRVCRCNRCWFPPAGPLQHQGRLLRLCSGNSSADQVQHVDTVVAERRGEGRGAMNPLFFCLSAAPRSRRQTSCR